MLLEVLGSKDVIYALTPIVVGSGGYVLYDVLEVVGSEEFCYVR